MVNPDSGRRQERPKKRWPHNVVNNTGVRGRILMGSTVMAGWGGEKWAMMAPTRTIIPLSGGTATH
jgi:hypothetical protein